MSFGGTGELPQVSSHLKAQTPQGSQKHHRRIRKLAELKEKFNNAKVIPEHQEIAQKLRYFSQ